MAETLSSEADFSRPLPAQNRTLSQFVRRWVFIISVPYLGAMAMVALWQRALIYHPVKVAALPVEKFPRLRDRARDLHFQTDKGLSLHGWHILATPEKSEALSAVREARPVLLYFPGNARHRGDRVDRLLALANLGFDVLVFDYRGYGENEGEPTEARLRQDAKAVWDYVTGPLGLAGSRVVLYGESLGGGVATRLAADCCLAGTPPGGLILQSTFNSLTAAGAQHYPWLPVSWLLIDRFPSDIAVKDVTCPILQLHGRYDTIVPWELGVKLHEAMPKQSSSGTARRLVELPHSNHNDVFESDGPLLRKSVYEFLESR